MLHFYAMILFALFVNLSLQGKVPASPLSQSLPIHNRTDYNFNDNVRDILFYFFFNVFIFIFKDVLLFHFKDVF